MRVSRSAAARRRSRGCAARPGRSRRARPASASSAGDGRYAVDAGRYAYAPRSETRPPTNGTTFRNQTRARRAPAVSRARRRRAARGGRRAAHACALREERLERGEVAQREAGHDHRRPTRSGTGAAARRRARAARRRRARSRACRPRSRRRSGVRPWRRRARGRGRRCRTRGRGPREPGASRSSRPRCGANRRPCGT